MVSVMTALAGAALMAAPVFAVQCPDGSPPPCGRASREAPASVAVLYFENLSRDTTDLYLADGLTEELTSRLGAVNRLRVTGRTVVRRAQQTAGGDALAVGRALNVRYLVEGSLRRAGTRVRVSARLLRASDGVRVWGDDYDRTMDDLLAMQVDIAQEVARNVAGQLLPAEQRVLARRPTANPAAYDHYLRGRYLVTRRTEATIRQAAAELDQALRLDPAFAAAEARRGQVLITAYGYGVPLAEPETLAARAARSIDRAMRLDSTASEAWLSLGLARLWFPPYDLNRSRGAFERAIALDPGNADAHHNLGVVLMTVPDLDAATAAFHRALAIEPGRGVSLLDIAQNEYSARRYASARRWIDSAAALEPGQARIFMVRALVGLRTGDTAGALADADRAVRLGGGNVLFAALAARVAVAAARNDAPGARRDLTGIAGDGRMPMARVLALVALGELDSALSFVERVPLLPIDRHWLWWPDLDPIRSSPRFTAAINRWSPPGARNP